MVQAEPESPTTIGITTDMSGEKSTRKHPVHGVLDIDGQPTVIFDTICTKGRETWLANSDVHQLLRTVWSAASDWAMGRYMILPDHIHYFAGATGDAIPYENWVQYWKSQFTRKHRVTEHRWQSDHWDTRMRSLGVYEEKWQYVRMNPVRHGFVDDPDEWLYQGEINRLVWE